MPGGEERLKLVLEAVDKVAAPIRRVNRRIESMLAPVRKVRNALKSLAVESGLPKLGRAFGATVNLAKRFATATVAGLGVVVAAVERISSKADELGKFARQYQINVEALQEWEFAAERSSVGADSLRKSIEQLAKRTGELKAGTGALKTLLDKSNPALAEQLKSTSDIGQAMEILLGAISKIEDPTRKAALANAAFGRSGLAMVRLANEGADGLSNLRARARELGLVLNSDATQQAEGVQDALTDLKSASSGLVNIIGVGLFPVVRQIADRMTEWVVANRSLIQSNVERVIQGILAAASLLKDNLAELLPPARRLIEELGGLEGIGTALGFVFKSIIIPQVKLAKTALTVLASTVEVLKSLFTAATDAIGINWTKVGETITGTIDSIIAKARSLLPSIPAPVRRFFGLEEGSVLGGPATPVGGTSAPAAAASAVQSGAASNVQVGGRMVIELDDRRARVKSIEPANPDVPIDFAGGEALAPA